MKTEDKKKQDVNTSAPNAGDGTGVPKDGKWQKTGRNDKKPAQPSVAEPSEEKLAAAREAERILAEHPEAEAVYMTSDGFGYFSEHDARNHARDLKDNEVKRFEHK